MYTISQFFYSSDKDEKKGSMYYEIFKEILSKKRNNIFTIYGILNTYSFNSKKKLEDILIDKEDIKEAINKLKNDNNIICYYYCKNDKIYNLLEYSISPVVRTVKNNNVKFNFNETIDELFSIDIDINILKNVIDEPERYINFCPKKNKIRGKNLLLEIINEKEEKLFIQMVNYYDIIITDTEIDKCVKYEDLLKVALNINSSVLVNFINKKYYDNKIKKYNILEIEKNDPYKNIYKYVNIGSNIISIVSLPLLIYLSNYAC